MPASTAGVRQPHRLVCRHSRKLWATGAQSIGQVYHRERSFNRGWCVEIRPCWLCGTHQAATRFKEPERNIMFYTIGAILLILWALGTITGYTMGGFIHVLLLVALVMVFLDLFTGHKQRA
jgi:hypothetical protein